MWKVVSGVFEATEHLMARWNNDETKSTSLRHTAEDTKSDDNGKRGGEGCAVVRVMFLSTKGKMKW